MAITYTQLSQALQDYLETTETTFVSQIPTFVKQAEERIHREVLIPDLRNTQTGTLTADNRYLNKPTDILHVAALSVVNGSTELFLQLKDETFIREAYPDESSSRSVPLYFSHFDDDFWLLGPTPDSGYTVNVRYYRDPGSIVDDETTWLGDNAESALLYGSLVEGYTFQKGEPDLIALYEARYKEALQNLVNMGLMRIRRDDYRGRERGVK